MDNYDYVVVGAGSAGCVITTRLVLAGKSVLLLEAGPRGCGVFRPSRSRARSAARSA